MEARKKEILKFKCECCGRDMVESDIGMSLRPNANADTFDHYCRVCANTFCRDASIGCILGRTSPARYKEIHEYIHDKYGYKVAIL